MLLRGFLQHPDARLSASAAIRRNVWAIIKSIKMRPARVELLFYQIVHGVYQRFRKVSAAYTGLIGDQENRQTSFVELSDRRWRKRKHAKT